MKASKRSGAELMVLSESMLVLGLSGSLRKASHNTAALRLLQAQAPQGTRVVLADIGALPLFNPDLEGEVIPAVDDMMSLLKRASGVVVASPEYAHGISGILKNALDWIVSNPDFVDMPVMLINTSPRATHAQVALREVLVTMSANIVEEACVTVPMLGKLPEEYMAIPNAVSQSLGLGITRFCDVISD